MTIFSLKIKRGSGQIQLLGYVGCLTNMELAKNTKEQRQRFYINIRVLIRLGRCLDWRISRGWVWSNVELDLCQNNVSPIIRLINMDLAKNTKEQRQRFHINIRVLIRPGRCLECPIWRG